MFLSIKPVLYPELTLSLFFPPKRGKDPAGFEQDLLLSYQSNVVGNTHLYNAYMPLILKGGEKKVIHLSSGHADIDLVLKHNIKSSMPYSITKYAMNLVSAKFSVEYSKDGVLFLNLSPGMVDNHNIDPATCKCCLIKHNYT